MDAKAYRQMADIQLKHWWFEGRRAILSSIIKDLDLPLGAQILEAGCGSGANLAMLGQFGEVKGFEPDDFVREKAQSLVSYPIERGFLPDQIPYDQQFDLVCALDVIEHIQQDAESLEALCKVTKVGGYAVFTVPAFQFMWSKHDEFNHHFRRYQIPDFSMLLEQAGYKIVFISYYNTLLFPLAYVVRMLKKLMKKDDVADLQMPKQDGVNKILASVFSFERHILKYVSMPLGLSIIAVCKR